MSQGDYIRRKKLTIEVSYRFGIHSLGTVNIRSQLYALN